MAKGYAYAAEGVFTMILTVTDTQTGAIRTYTNPQGTAFEPIQDTHAFPCP